MEKMTREIIENHNLSKEEYDKIKNILGREPNITELGMYSVLWSEHCSYKSSKPLLKTLPTTGEKIIQGPGENAGIINIGDDLAVVMKVESHNHPSAIEPYQGAATGIGGIIRDIITMGARPIALLNSLRFGQLEKGKNRHLFTKVVEGIAGYGNCVGIPTTAGEIYFDDCYEGNPLVNVMCVGIVKTNGIVNAIAKGQRNSVIYAGAPTGKDGVKGASFASKELHDKSEEDLPSVQVGDPFMGKLLIEACMEIAPKDYLIAMQDMGAAGLTSSSAEMASRGNIGMIIDLDKVPKRERNLSPYEIMLSESQERMLVVVQRGFENKAISIFKKWGLSASKIGELVPDEFLTVKEKGKIVARVPAESLSNPPISQLNAEKPKYIKKLETNQNNELYAKLSNKENYNKSLEQILASPNIASKKAVYQQYDHTIGTNTAVLPGKADASIIRIKDTKKAIALSIDGNSRYCYIDPFVGGQITVCEATRNIVCTGAKPLAITDGLNFGNPNDPEVFWTFTKAIEGIKKACRELNTPIVSGNVSLYNEKEGQAIYPSPIIGVMGIISDIDKIITRAFKNDKDIIILLGDNLDELDASEYLNVIHKSIGIKSPIININLEKLIQKTCLSLINKKLIKSAHDISEGGLAVAITESCIDNNLGANISFTNTGISTQGLLFGESQSRIIISISPDNLYSVTSYLEYNNIPYHKIGTVTSKKRLTINKYIDMDIAILRKAMEESLVM